MRHPLLQMSAITLLLICSQGSSTRAIAKTLDSTTTVAPAGDTLPDLSISNPVWRKYRGIGRETTTIKVTVHNQGQGCFTGSICLSYWLEDWQVNVQGWSPARAYYLTIAPGDSTNIDTGFKNPASGSIVKLWLRTDCVMIIQPGRYPKIHELSDSNNFLECRVPELQSEPIPIRR